MDVPPIGMTRRDTRQVTPKSQISHFFVEAGIQDKGKRKALIFLMPRGGQGNWCSACLVETLKVHPSGIVRTEDELTGKTITSINSIIALQSILT